MENFFYNNASLPINSLEFDTLRPILAILKNILLILGAYIVSAENSG